MNVYIFLLIYADTKIVANRAHDTHTEFNDTTLKLKICGELLNLDMRTHKHLQPHSKHAQKLQKQSKIQNQITGTTLKPVLTKYHNEKGNKKNNK